jgi:hypothetical protein
MNYRSIHLAEALSEAGIVLLPGRLKVHLKSAPRRSLFLSIPEQDGASRG